MPITAYSREAKGELDLEQWLARNGYSPKSDPTLVNIPQELRTKVASDIECSCCEVVGASLVRVAHSKSTGKAIGQGHFRFSNPHRPLCDYVDEKAVTGGEYLTRFADDKKATTKIIRQLVCNGIAAELFSQADMRQMRVWFLCEKEKHAVVMPVTVELLNWCVDAWRAKAYVGDKYPFHPDQGQLPNFDWQRAANLEWSRQNADLLSHSEGYVHFHYRDTIKRPVTLANQLAGKVVLDPTALQEKYEDAVTLARFSAKYVFADTKNIYGNHEIAWGTQGNAMLALSALLLFKSDWNLDAAVSLFIRLKMLPQTGTGLEGNLIGLNPFHDYEAWRVINAARQIGAKRTDMRPVQEQVASVLIDMQAQWMAWLSSQSPST